MSGYTPRRQPWALLEPEAQKAFDRMMAAYRESAQEARKAWFRNRPRVELPDVTLRNRHLNHPDEQKEILPNAADGE